MKLSFLFLVAVILLVGLWHSVQAEPNPIPSKGKGVLGGHGRRYGGYGHRYGTGHGGYLGKYRKLGKGYGGFGNYGGRYGGYGGFGKRYGGYGGFGKRYGGYGGYGKRYGGGYGYGKRYGGYGKKFWGKG